MIIMRRFLSCFASTDRSLTSDSASQQPPHDCQPLSLKTTATLESSSCTSGNVTCYLSPTHHQLSSRLPYSHQPSSSSRRLSVEFDAITDLGSMDFDEIALQRTKTTALQWQTSNQKACPAGITMTFASVPLPVVSTAEAAPDHLLPPFSPTAMLKKQQSSRMAALGLKRASYQLGIPPAANVTGHRGAGTVIGIDCSKSNSEVRLTLNRNSRNNGAIKEPGRLARTWSASTASIDHCLDAAEEP